MKKYILICGISAMLLLGGCGSNASTAIASDILSQETATFAEADTVQETTEAGMTTDTSNATSTATTTVTPEPTEVPSPTLTKMLQTALLPVGNTMYIWGGGWNEEDNGAGPGATTIGLRPEWATFTALQNENYDYKNHKYEILNGLDCSGYAGWVIYNLFEQEDNKDGYVFKSTNMASEYSQLGWGELLENPTSFVPGDIVSIKGHVWISLGMCSDGSTLLVHASPPGVSICGTALKDSIKSQAVTLAEQYMEAYYPKWQAKYPDREVGISYTQNTTVMRWSESVLEDATEFHSLSAEEVLKKILD